VRAGGQAYNVVIDHCSLSWAVDENLSAPARGWRGRRNGAPRDVQQLHYREGLSHATHAKGEHSKGSLIHDCCQRSRSSQPHAHNVQRNPYLRRTAPA
jgi:hypothetical protein